MKYIIALLDFIPENIKQAIIAFGFLSAIIVLILTLPIALLLVFVYGVAYLS